MSEALRDNTGKPMLSFILQFPTACIAFAQVKTIGAIKYLRDNWKIGGKPDYEYLDAALRHIMAFMDGEMYAQDTGCTHLGHAMWNIMALQELNYKGITHDPELFKNMCEYWKTRREAEARGIKIDLTAEQFFENRMHKPVGDGTLWETRQFKEGGVKGPLKSYGSGGRYEDGGGEIDMDIHKVHGKLGPPAGRSVAEAAAMAVDFTDDPDEATRDAANALLENILGPEPMKTFDFPAIGTFDFDEPLTVHNGEVMKINLQERSAKILNELGEVLATTGLTVTETTAEPIDVQIEFTCPKRLPEAGEIIGKTEAPVEELREQARVNIEQHTSLCQKEKAVEDKREAEMVIYRQGRDAGQLIRTGVMQAARDQAFRAGQQQALAALALSVNGLPLTEEDAVLDDDTYIEDWMDSDYGGNDFEL